MIHGVRKFPKVGCGRHGRVALGRGSKHMPRLVDGVAVQRTDYCLRVYVISIIFISLPPW
jgi:hypothetical protein